MACSALTRGPASSQGMDSDQDLLSLIAIVASVCFGRQITKITGISSLGSCPDTFYHQSQSTQSYTSAPVVVTDRRKSSCLGQSLGPFLSQSGLVSAESSSITPLGQIFAAVEAVVIFALFRSHFLRCASVICISVLPIFQYLKV